jgi:hypothetical protein
MCLAGGTCENAACAKLRTGDCCPIFGTIETSAAETECDDAVTADNAGMCQALLGQVQAVNLCE